MNRPQQHLSKTATMPRKDRNNGRLTKRQAWLKQLWNLGIKPEIKILASCNNEKELVKKEKDLILVYKKDLTNLTDGGEGVCGRAPWNKGLKGHEKCRGGRPSGGIPWNKGIPCNKKVKDKISNSLMGNIPSNAKPVICSNDNKEYASTGEAARAYGLKTSEVYAVCSGRRKTTKGYIFIYAHKKRSVNGK